MAIIYKLTVGNYWYIGRTTNSFRSRFRAHCKSCFNRSKRSYHSKIYKTMRKLGVKKSTWDEQVKNHIVYVCSDEYVDYYEYALINSKCPWSLNTEDKDVKEKYEKQLVKWGTRTEEDLKNKKKNYYKKYKEREQRKSRNRQVNYRENNKDEINERTRNQYQYNKRFKCQCCNSNVMIKAHYKRHLKTKKHLKNSL